MYSVLVRLSLRLPGERDLDLDLDLDGYLPDYQVSATSEWWVVGLLCPGNAGRCSVAAASRAALACWRILRGSGMTTCHKRDCADDQVPCTAVTDEDSVS